MGDLAYTTIRFEHTPGFKIEEVLQRLIVLYGGNTVLLHRATHSLHIHVSNFEAVAEVPKKPQLPAVAAHGKDGQVSVAEKAFNNLWKRVEKCNMDDCVVCPQLRHEAEVVRQALRTAAKSQVAPQIVTGGETGGKRVDEGPSEKLPHGHISPDLVEVACFLPMDLEIGKDQHLLGYYLLYNYNTQEWHLSATTNEQVPITMNRYEALPNALRDLAGRIEASGFPYTTSEYAMP